MLAFLKRMDKASRTLLYTCFFAYFCSGVCSLMMGSAMPDLKANYGFGDTLGGLLLSAHSAGNLVAGFISGLVPLYMGQRRAITLLSALTYIGILMMALWGNPIWLLLAFLLVGLGRGSVTNFNNRMANLLSGGSPAATNLLHASFAVGAILAPMIFLGMRTAVSWQVGLLMAVALGAISVWNLSRMKIANDHPDPKDKTNSTMAFLKNPSYLILAMMMFCYLCSEYAINGWLVTYIQSKHALLSSLGSTAEEQASGLTAYSQTMATLLWAVILVGRLVCASLSARVPQKRLMLGASIGVAAFFGAMLLGNTLALVTLSVAGLGFCMAGICPMIYSDAAVFTNTYPLATSTILAIGSSGAILMPTIVGATAERFGFTGGMSAIFVTMLLLVVFATLNVTVKTRMPKEIAGQTQA